MAALDHSLAAQTRYPAPVRQGNSALAWLGRNAARFGGNPTRMVVGGDSAGAQIASQLAAVETSPRLAAAMVLTPGIPATYLTVGYADPFRSQATELAGILRARDVPVSTLFWSGHHLGHEYQFHFSLPEATVNLNRTLAFLRPRLGGVGGHD